MLCLDEIQFLVQHQLCHTHRIIVQSLGVHIKMNNLTTTTSFKNRLFKSSFRFMTKLNKNQQFLVYVSDSTHKYILSVNTPHQRDALIAIHGPALGFTLDGVYSLSFDKYVMTCIPL